MDREPTFNEAMADLHAAWSVLMKDIKLYFLQAALDILDFIDWLNG